MRFITLFGLGLILAYSAAWSNEHPGNEGKGENLEHRKKEILTEVDLEISMFQAFRSCVSSANDHDAMKRCRQERKTKMNEMRSQRKGRRREKIDEQIKNLQTEKEKLSRPNSH